VTKFKRVAIELSLEYLAGRDEPQRGIYRNFPVEPKHTRELSIAIRSNRDPAGITPDNRARYGKPQIHLAGTARALEAFGRYLIALARLETADPEPYDSFDAVRNVDGGTIRLLTRRITKGKQLPTAKQNRKKSRQLSAIRASGPRHD